jgi:hypothetical protein
VAPGLVKSDQTDKPLLDNFCKYVSPDGSYECDEQALQGENYCILHVDFPNESEESERTANSKNRKVAEKISHGDVSFVGANLDEIVLRNLHTEADEMGDAMDLRYSKINSVLFEHVIAKCDISFESAVIGVVIFDKNTEIYGEIYFDRARLGTVSFQEAKTMFVSFEEAQIDCLEFSPDADIPGISLHGTRFPLARSQEEACRTAKSIYENLGDRDEADYYFYREMEAKRKLKHPLIRQLEKLVQYCFGYGVYPLRVFFTWLILMWIFAFVYWLGNGIEETNSLLECIAFSIRIIMMSGYGAYHPRPVFDIIASSEVILGVFMWTAFITTFARKYMR